VKPYRCRATVHWWDCDLTARCIRQGLHRGAHSDGIRLFDDNGLQVPHSPQHPATPAHGPTSGYRARDLVGAR
jgi:hypothetical protein